MWRRAEFIKCPLQFWVNLWVFGIKMTVYTYRIAWYRSFFNFSLVLNKFNEILLHQKYIQIIDKNCWKMACLQRCFYWIFSIKPHLIFFPSCSFRNKLFKTVLTCQKVQVLRELCPLKVCLWKTKIWVFPLEKAQIFAFHRQTLREHKSPNIWTFWTCKTSFEKLISRATKWKKDQVGFH